MLKRIVIISLISFNLLDSSDQKNLPPRAPKKKALEFYSGCIGFYERRATCSDQAMISWINYLWQIKNKKPDEVLDLAMQKLSQFITGEPWFSNRYVPPKNLKKSILTEENFSHLDHCLQEAKKDKDAK